MAPRHFTKAIPQMGFIIIYEGLFRAPPPFYCLSEPNKNSRDFTLRLRITSGPHHSARCNCFHERQIPRQPPRNIAQRVASRQHGTAPARTATTSFLNRTQLISAKSLTHQNRAKIERNLNKKRVWHSSCFTACSSCESHKQTTQREPVSRATQSKVPERTTLLCQTFSPP